jgi:hypothetical protein
MGYCCKLCPSNNPRRKISQGLISGEHAGQIPLLIILSPMTSDKACYTCSVGSSLVLLKVAIGSFFFC